MNVIVVFGVLAVALFAAAFLTKRRFGLLGLALAAGATLTSIWSYNAGLIVAGTGLVPNGPLTTAVTLASIVLLPAILLLFHGYAYKSIPGRIVGALAFTLLALAFLVEPLQYALVLEGQGAQVFDTIYAYRHTVIGFGIVAAIVDLFFTKPAVLSDKDKKKK